MKNTPLIKHEQIVVVDVIDSMIQVLTNLKRNVNSEQTNEFINDDSNTLDMEHTYLQQRLDYYTELNRKDSE